MKEMSREDPTTAIALETEAAYGFQWYVFCRKKECVMTSLRDQCEKLKEKNKTLSASLDKAKEGSVLKRLEDAKLRQDYEAALKTLDSIPPEVIRFYENRTQEPVMRHDK